MMRRPGHLAALVLCAAVLAAPVRAQDGQGLLAQAGCAGCHGPEGRGTALAPAITGPGLPAAQFRAAVRSARGAMPAFGAAVLPDAAVAALYEDLSAAPRIAMPAGRIEAGAARYEQVGCYSCHSNQGQGGTQGPRLGPEPVRWERFVWYVRHPAGQMPPYSELVLPDHELADIYAFLAARPAPQPVSRLPLLAP